MSGLLFLDTPGGVVEEYEEADPDV